MDCPFDGTRLDVVRRSGVEIDWCPSCKGVWLERGELDTLIDLAARPAPVSSRHDDDDDDDRDDRYDRDDRPRKKRRGLLGEIFDF